MHCARMPCYICGRWPLPPLAVVTWVDDLGQMEPPPPETVIMSILYGSGVIAGHPVRLLSVLGSTLLRACYAHEPVHNIYSI